MDSAIPPVSSRLARRGLFQVVPERRSTPERTKASTLDSRVHNRSLVLATLFHRGPMTRPEIALASGLTAPTISALVGELEQDGLVADIGPRAGSRRGKPAGLVRIEDDALNLVVLDLSHSDRFTGAVLNLRGEVVARAHRMIGEAVGDAAAALAFALAGDLMELAPRRVLGIGVGTPGIVDDTGVLRQAAHLEWNDLPLAARLTAEFGVPAFVGNDINVAALAVRNFRGVRSQNLVVVSIEHGVGAGLIIGGELVEGDQFAAGEIGHVTVWDGGHDGADGEPCVCGRRGCLDQLIDAAHVRRALAGAADEAERTAVFQRAGRALGTVLAPIVSVLNLNDIVLTGPADLVEGPFSAAVTDTIRARTLAPISASVVVHSLAGDQDLILLGAGCLVLSAELGVL
ncbi:MAG: ROK family transcriptional regulator [Catenulispora sp.]|nr:ROK family transcriptional regulator [Catenulispora sp.]